MTTYKNLITGSTLLLSLWATASLGAVDARQAAALGQALTPVGAEKAGNAEGSIPAWNGGLAKDAGSVDGSGFMTDPYAGDRPLFTITADNAEQYRDRLSEGQLALFKRYPQTFRMPVYPSHRSAVFPDGWLEKTRENAEAVSLSGGGNTLEHYRMGVPFPIAGNGLEAIWNHMARYMGSTLQRNIITSAPQASGQFTPSLLDQYVAMPWALSDAGTARNANVLFYYKWRTVSPARLAGDVLLVHETLDQVKEPRLAWAYNAGQRRVRRAPQVSYDGPSTTSDGQHTSDNFMMFNGAPDRYDWTLVGKQEMYVPYNAYHLDDPGLKYADIIGPGHLNPDHTRYELHRVWVVEANLKSGSRHIYARRRLYLDEDTWQALVADHYDNRGQIWRVAEGHLQQVYQQQLPLILVETCYDLLNGRYFVSGLRNEIRNAPKYGIELSSNDFTPASLRRTGVR
ncbi:MULTISPECIES: DUF1329 domain-containing protein [unclassified Pseudomonas]|uniref:DUF1329 domain-containing protein n=1 Tax=unclassified Pseudomonas TaxID=196821 RepID=UPI00244D7A8B|nr:MULTISPECIES: DUF1329 domain-containing protein [unclassified Pseudomonas]MDG9926990.1 DUF1329 domain-containing protein [Pseudomonas sp. GD04042]MDH0485901.1 DUF1329 domain-containing protein [Pseudomonas sp. GD04015]MDH0602405.1 DUF1329 domain-containing protein [Pseudomonas sp. GD03869]